MEKAQPSTGSEDAPPGAAKRTCTKCEQEKPLADFFPRQSHCRDCQREESLAWAADHREEAVERTRRWREQNPDAYEAELERMRERRATGEIPPNVRTNRWQRTVSEQNEIRYGGDYYAVKTGSMEGQIVFVRHSGDGLILYSDPERTVFVGKAEWMA